MQKLRRNYAEIMQKLCRNYAKIMQKLCIFYANKIYASIKSPVGTSR